MKVIAFQVILCIRVCCVGVSIIWCAILGWILMLFLHEISGTDKNPQAGCNNKIVRITIGADSLIVAYYGLVADAITTTAHCCAILLGAILWVVFEHHLFLIFRV